MVDANAPGQQLIGSLNGQYEPLAKLMYYLSTIADDSAKLTGPVGSLGNLELVSRDGKTRLLRYVADDSIRLAIEAIEEEGAYDTHTVQAMQSELETLRTNTQAAPFLLWRQDSEGRVTWINNAYLDACRLVFDDARIAKWPLPSLIPALKSDRKPQITRLPVTRRGIQEPTWYDCHITPVGREFLCTAISADEAVHSENRRREFTQALTKTFADLAIGLAIFDQSRRLFMFNPALADLTSLPAEFLANKPTMVSFLDRLRENRVMPEPRDYRTWRKSIVDLEAEAVNGTYGETWSLPNGHTYHVTGRPHPEGAVALLFEDISAEMSLTRRFRAEIERSQTVLDALDDSVAVFSASGETVLTNRAYQELWGLEDDATGADVKDSTRIWHEKAFPTPVWGDFREFAQRTQDREEWSAYVVMQDGRTVRCSFVPQKGGGTLALFRLTAVRDKESGELRDVI